MTFLELWWHYGPLMLALASLATSPHHWHCDCLHQRSHLDPCICQVVVFTVVLHFIIPVKLMVVRSGFLPTTALSFLPPGFLQLPAGNKIFIFQINYDRRRCRLQFQVSPSQALLPLIHLEGDLRFVLPVQRIDGISSVKCYKGGMPGYEMNELTLEIFL